MSFNDLRSFIRSLEKSGDLVRITRLVDPDQEITIIQHRVLQAGGPALLFENVKGSPYRVVSNLFGTPERVNAIFAKPPAEIGSEVAALADQLMPPTAGSIWKSRRVIKKVLRARMRRVRSGPILESTFDPPRINSIPCLKCWPLDGGAFFTLPLVHTIDPETGQGNLGIYRLQRFDDASTGMHWQIEKGGGFHFNKACNLNQPLPLSVFLGGAPALTIAAIAPLPEGMDERLLASLIMGEPLDVILRRQTGHRIPASSEFVLEGSVSANDTRREGPFGDHLGHYSHSADFPVFRIDRMLARKDAIYPATVVGKPPQEDYFIGEALQELTLPMLKCIKPGISELWAYPETGFHPLAVVSVNERYRHEGLKQAMAILGQGQLSLTKVLIVVDSDVNVRDFNEVGRAILKNFDPLNDLYLLAPAAQDTLDFTGPKINEGSRMIIVANSGGRPPQRTPPPEPPAAESIHKDITGIKAMNEAVLMVQVRAGADKEGIREALARNPATALYIFNVMVSEDVPLNDNRLMLWGWFTRFDPLTDTHPARRESAGNRVNLHAPLSIDATWKEGYRQPVTFDPVCHEKVGKNWNSYGINL